MLARLDLDLIIFRTSGLLYISEVILYSTLYSDKISALLLWISYVPFIHILHPFHITCHSNISRYILLSCI
jgi:hypothetical protein